MALKLYHRRRTHAICTTASALRDMEHHIGLANRFVAGLDYEACRIDIRTGFRRDPVS